MNLQKLLAARDGHRATLEDLFFQLETAKENNLYDEFELCFEMINDVLALLKSVDEKITNTTDTENIATELRETAAYSFHLKLKLHRYKKHSANAKHGSSATPASLEHEAENTNQSSMPHIQAPAVQEPSEMVQRVHEQLQMPHHLPKLTLPSFNGEIMNWPTFWDSFSSAVHNNPRLPDIQKFSYLKSLMQEEAARTIEGFTLSNANYQQAVNLLQQWYGQIQKITAAYMSNLLQLPSPAANIRELRNFYDRLETNIRGLEALGEAQDSYGNLLIPIILERLPSETRRNLARENKTKTWTLRFEASYFSRDRY